MPFIARQFAAAPPAGGSPLSRLEHPRLLVTSDNLTAQLAKVQTGGRFNSEWNDLVTYIDTNWATLESPLGEIAPLNGCAVALIYTLWLGGATETAGTYHGVSYDRSRGDYATKARGIMEANRSASASQIGGIGVNGWAVVYDHLVPSGVMSSGDRAAFAAWFKTIDTHGPAAIPYAPMGVTQVTDLRACRLLFALALHGDGYEDTWAAANITQAAFEANISGDTGTGTYDSIFSEATGGTPPEGPGYGSYYTFHPFLWAFEGWRTANGLTRASMYNETWARVIKARPAFFAHRIEPWEAVNGGAPGGRDYAIHNEHYASPMVFPANTYYVAGAIAVVEGMLDGVDANLAGVCQWLVQNRTGFPNALLSNGHRLGPLAILTAAATAPAAVTPSTAGFPLAARLGTGLVVVRNSFDDIAGYKVTIDVPKWVTMPSIRNRRSGAIDISRKGTHVTHMSGDGGHVAGPAGLTGSASMMAFPDRTVVTPGSATYYTSGGARRTVNGAQRASDLVNGSEWDYLSELRFEPPSGGATSTYVGANLTRAYDSDDTPDTGQNRTCISAYWRRVIVFGSSSNVVVMCFDRTVTKATDFVQTQMWLLSGTPSVDGTESDAPARLPGALGAEYGTEGVHYWRPTSGAHAHKTYTGATLVTTTQTTEGFDGKTWITPILPSSRTIVRVGGPNSSSESWVDSGGTGGEFSAEHTDLWGIRNWHVQTSAHARTYGSSYRIEINAATTATSQEFLTAVEVADSTASQTTTQGWTLGAGWYALRVGTKVGAFAVGGENRTSGTLILEVAGTYELTMEGFSPSTVRTFALGANVTSLTRIEDSDTDLTYTASAYGTLRFTVVVGSSGTGAANTITVS